MKSKKSFSFLAVLAFCFFCFISCNSDKLKNDENNEIPVYARYGLKSCIVEMEATTMGMKQTINIYFKDFGKIIANEIKMNTFGMNTSVKTIIRDGYVYSYDNTGKIATKVKIDSTSYDNINYLNLDEKKMKEYNIKYIGKSEILGKECKDYKILVPGQNLEAEASVWQGIALKTTAKAMGITMTVEAKSIKENVEIPDNIFEIPDNIQFKEIDQKLVMQKK